MERLHRLLEKEKWTVKTLSEVSIHIYSGHGITKAQLNSGPHPSVKCGDITDGLDRYFHSCINHINPSLVSRPRYFFHGDLLINAIGSPDTVGTAVLYLGHEKCLAGNDVIVLRTNQNPKYLSYVFGSRSCKRQIRKNITPSTVSHLYIKNLRKIRIPVPPLHIQALIVHHLDKWMDLEQRLTSELRGRLLQCSYYLNKMVIDGAFRWSLKPLSEVATHIYEGNGVIASQLGTGTQPAIKNKDLNRLPSHFTRCISFVDPDLISKKKYCEHGDLLISNMGGRSSIGRCRIYLGRRRCIAGNHVIVLKHRENPKFLSYILSSRYYEDQVTKYARGTTIYNLNLSLLRRIKIPVPPLPEQNRIVEVMDKLHAITMDCRGGIPRMLTQVRRQYEHYRRLMLED